MYNNKTIEINILTILKMYKCNPYKSYNLNQSKSYRYTRRINNKSFNHKSTLFNHNKQLIRSHNFSRFLLNS